MAIQWRIEVDHASATSLLIRRLPRRIQRGQFYHVNQGPCEPQHGEGGRSKGERPTEYSNQDSESMCRRSSCHQMAQFADGRHLTCRLWWPQRLAEFEATKLSD